MTNLTRRNFLATIPAAAIPLAALKSSARAVIITQPGAPKTGDDHRGPCVLASLNGLRATIRAKELIDQGFDPADAIVQGIRIIEDDPTDDSVGLGGLPNADGIVELDASVMHGPTHKSGAVASLRNIKNPAMVALAVLRRTDHCLLVAEGALRFALLHGFREENLLTEAARQEWVRWKENNTHDDDYLNDDEKDSPTGKTWDRLPWQSEHDDQPKDDTRENDGPQLKSHTRRNPSRPYTTEVTGTVHVNCVTPKGDIASATSTSGLNWKIPSRVGDSPIIGAGNYCDNNVGAAGCTGRGEACITNLAAFQVVNLMAEGLSPTAACLEVAKRVADHTKEKRLKNPDGSPNFNVRFYALRKDGAYGCATLWSGHKFAVNDSTGPKALDAPYLFESKP
ncbi:MAG: N(4)-(beta-N-acetylglucosaminyl)-L-asparaginase [Phycisphaerales bacterium]